MKMREAARCLLSAVDGRRASTLVSRWARRRKWQQRVSSRSVGKELVGDAHFHVVGLAGEHQQRLVLRLPSEARDGAVVAVVVGLAGDGSAGDGEVRATADPERACSAVLAAWFARIASPESLRSGRSPKTGVGIRKITLWLATCVAKSGCGEWQPVAPGAR